MIKSNTNHACPKVTSILQVPKPFQRKKQVKNRIKTIGYNEKYHIKCIRECLQNKDGLYLDISTHINNGSSMASLSSVMNWQNNNPENSKICLKKQSNEIMQPIGDVNDSPYMSVGELKECMSHSLNLSTSKTEKNTPKINVKTTYQLMKKQKPALLTARTNCDDVLLENQILKIQNQKLKQLSEERKNQISTLIKELLDLKSQITNNDNSEYIEIKKAKQIEQILNLEQEIAKQSRSMIAKDIYKRLKSLFSSRLKNFEDEEENRLIFQL